MKKLNNYTYKNINVLLVTAESRFSNCIENYFEILQQDLKNQLKEKFKEKKIQFKEIYLLDYSNVLLRLF